MLLIFCLTHPIIIVAFSQGIRMPWRESPLSRAHARQAERNIRDLFHYDPNELPLPQVRPLPVHTSPSPTKRELLHTVGCVFARSAAPCRSLTAPRCPFSCSATPQPSKCSPSCMPVSLSRRRLTTAPASVIRTPPSPSCVCLLMVLTQWLTC